MTSRSHALVLAVASLSLLSACGMQGDEQPRTWSAPSKEDSAYVAGFSGMLRSMGEPDLQGGPSRRSATVLRMLAWPSFEPTTTVRIVRDAGRCRVVTTVLSLPTVEWGPPDSSGLQMAVRTHPGTVLRRDSTDIELRECEELDVKAADPRVWTGTADARNIGPDGESWMFERTDSSGYRVSARWSGIGLNEPAFQSLGQIILRLGRAPPPERVY